MQSFFGKTLFLSFILVLVALASSCDDDKSTNRKPDPDYSLVGNWQGEYVYFVDRFPESDIEYTQKVFVKFDSNSFQIALDTSTSVNHCFCKISGLYDYQYREKVWFSVIYSVPMGGNCTSCNHDENPFGDFEYLRTVDTVVLLQSISPGTPGTTKKITIVRQ